ncbi:hypothetical protein HELRODRAFT_184060 [Helobdella robusta]|uniref:Uncharacterized protein n=1 Tax=Helobdella robusta TaxID=6412 RepID=T1FKI3_HELRO|nr:hypothetical protein HELRODRAFT_184060 [Helobdella robusta]ESO08301.1 hypothetical protein HELRODRAFT_184060 [Helobdella robusta]
MDRKIRTLLTKYGFLHPKADIDRFYISRNSGDRRLIEPESAYKRAVVGVSEYITQKSDKYIKLVFSHEKKREKNRHFDGYTALDSKSPYSSSRSGIKYAITSKNVKQVNSFNYLGSLITSDCKCDVDIKRRIAMTKNAYSKMKNVLTNSKIRLSTKLKLSGLVEVDGRQCPERMRHEKEKVRHGYKHRPLYLG